jgi:hypothetical protein
MKSGILKKLNGKFDAIVVIQDGVEKVSDLNTIQEAIQEYKQMQYFYNRNDEPKITMFEEKQTIETKIFEK